MRIVTIPVGMLQVNCYLLYDDESRQALVVDPGDDAERIAERIRTLKLTPRGILLTHAHVDHIRAVGPLAGDFGIPVSLHADDKALYHSPVNALPPWLEAAEDLPEPGRVPDALPGLNHVCIHTPGHTPGGRCFHFPEADVLISGDTLFAGSIGRTDLPGGDTETLLNSITTKLMILPAPTVVYPGHGPTTTIESEKHTNPFF